MSREDKPQPWQLRHAEQYRRYAANCTALAAECRRLAGLTDMKEVRDVLANYALAQEQHAGRYEGYATESEYAHLYDNLEGEVREQRDYHRHR